MAIELIPDLRPMKMGQLLDQAARLYRSNFIPFVGIVALVQVPITVVQLLINLRVYAEPFSASTAWPFGAELLGTILSFIFIQGIGTAAMTRAVADNYLGEKTGALQAYRSIGRGWLSLLAALFILGLIGIAAALWLLVPCVGWLTGLGIIFYLFFVITPLVAPTIILEGERASEGWRRAWQLARQRFWWILGFFVVLYAFNLLVVIGPVILTELILTEIWGTLWSGFSVYSPAQLIIQQLVTLAFSLLFLPFQLAATTLVYFDLRVRSEGFDLALRAQELVGGHHVVAELVSRAPQAAKVSLITKRELAYFAGLSLIPMAIYFALIALFAALTFVLAGGGF